MKFFRAIALTAAISAISAALPVSAAQSTQQTLYVLNARSDGKTELDVYTPGATQPRVRITGGLAGTAQIAVDVQGRRYAANFGTAAEHYADASLTKYARGTTVPSLTISGGVFGASGIAADGAGDILASLYYANAVAVFPPGAVTPSRSLTTGIRAPQQLAVANDALYVDEPGIATIVRFAPGSPSPRATFALRAPGTLPLGAIVYGGPFVVGVDGTLYASGAVIAQDVGFETFVDVFAPDGVVPRRTLTVFRGRDAGQAPALALSGNLLYVSDNDAGVRAYDVSSLKLRRTIATTAAQPHPVAVDAAGTIYIADGAGFLIYGANASAPLRIALPEAGVATEMLVAR